MASFSQGDPYAIPVGFRSLSSAAGSWDGSPVVILSPDRSSVPKGVIATTPFNSYENNCLHAFFDTAGLTPLPAGWTITGWGTSGNLPVSPKGRPHSCFMNWGSSGAMTLSLDYRNSRFQTGYVLIEWKPMGSGMVFAIVNCWRNYEGPTYWCYGTCCSMSLSSGILRSAVTILGGSTGWTGSPAKDLQWAWDNIPASPASLATRGILPAPSSAVPQYPDPLRCARESGLWSVSGQVWGELATKCIGAFQLFSGNGIAYIADLLTMRRFVESTLETAKHALTNLSKADAAKLYLSWHYGASLTISDTRSLLKAMKDYSYRVSVNRESRSGATITLEDGRECRMSMYASPYDLRTWEFLRTLNEFDLLPTAGNLWDLVPFSFVVDWVLNVSDQLDALDAQSSLSVIPITRTCMSVKGRVEIPNVEQFAGHGYVHFYRRTFVNGPVNPRAPCVTSSPSGLIDHMVEGSSLVVTHLGK